MIDSKLVFIVIIILIVMAIFLGSNQNVSQFFSAVTDRLSAVARIEAPVARNLNFTLTTDKNPEINFDSIRNITLEIQGDTEATLVEGNLNTSRLVKIINYRGYGTLANDLNLDGYFEKLQMPEITATFGKENIKLHSVFTSIRIENLAVKDLKIANTTGYLAIRGAVTQFTGDIEIKDVLGTFDLDNNTFSLTGFAQKISIPNIGINIG
ncbi:MAG: hypothetical protein NT120_01245 [Candidatus Aenigmarchaeota archaeon]|nr:hypothetical protein [Candidatus Aenigmarchaeota archaeon]